MSGLMQRAQRGEWGNAPGGDARAAARVVGRGGHQLEGHLGRLALRVDRDHGRVRVAAVEHGAALGGRLAAHADHDLHGAAEDAGHLRAAGSGWGQPCPR